MGDDMIYTGGGHPQGVPLPFRQPHVGLSLFDAIALGRWARGEMALAHFFDQSRVCWRRRLWVLGYQAS